MCNFLSAIVMRNGDVHCQPEHTDSHTHLILAIGLEDSGDSRLRGWLRVEFLPPNDGNWSDLTRWELSLDEEFSPSWWDGHSQVRARDRLSRIVQRMIVRDKRPILLGGCWILLDGADVGEAVNCRIMELRGSSQVGVMRGSSRVGEMWDSSQVGEMRDSSQVGTMWGSSIVEEMRGSSRVGEMLGSSRVGETRDSSRVEEMWGSSIVEEMWDSSQVGEMWDSSQVGTMRGSSQVGTMRGSSRVGEMLGSSRVVTDMRPAR